MNKSSITTVFFDLDGTLLDTAPDLAFALNKIVKKYRNNNVDFVDFRYHVHGGSETMLQFGLNLHRDDPKYGAIRQEFLEIYRGHLNVDTTLFSGMTDVLDYLDHHHIPWGIITNKVGWLTQPLLEHFKLLQRTVCVVCADSVEKRKPHPMPLLHACQLANVLPEHAVYIGDTQDDVSAAKAAGMAVIAARYGYHQKNSNPDEWNADLLINHPSELIEWFKKYLNFPEKTLAKNNANVHMTRGKPQGVCCD